MQIAEPTMLEKNDTNVYSSNTVKCGAEASLDARMEASGKCQVALLRDEILPISSDCIYLQRQRYLGERYKRGDEAAGGLLWRASQDPLSH